MRLFSNLNSFISAWRDYPAEVNTELGNRYTVQAMVGAGSYGITYKCRDETDGKLVAVKQARPSKGSLAKHLLQRESEILKALQHPKIPAFVDQFTEKSNTYLVMSFVSGDTLEDLIFEKDRKYDELDCIRITLQLLELVSYIHKQGFVHLDLRIPNVLFNEDELHLIDFGLARQIGEPETVTPSVRIKFKMNRSPSKQPKDSTVTSDLQDIGHFMLFMLYSTYEPERQGSPEEQSWQEELELTHELRVIIERLLNHREPYSDSSEFIEDLQALANS